MNLFEKLKEYILGITVNNGISIVAIKIKPEWVVTPSNLVGVNHKKENGTISLYGMDQTVTLDTILDKLRTIVDNNIENELKNELFNIKINELDQLFSTNSLDKLKSLSFTFNEMGNITNTPKTSPEENVLEEVINDNLESVVEPIELVFNPMEEVIQYNIDEMESYEDMTLSEIAALKNIK